MFTDFIVASQLRFGKKNIYDNFGPSAFIPVQRIFCRYICAEGKLYNKNVSYICPIMKGMNV